MDFNATNNKTGINFLVLSVLSLGILNNFDILKLKKKEIFAKSNFRL